MEGKSLVNKILSTVVVPTIIVGSTLLNSCSPRKYLTHPETNKYSSNQNSEYFFNPIEKFGEKYFQINTETTPILVKKEDMKFVNVDNETTIDPIKKYTAMPLKTRNGGFVDEFAIRKYLKKEIANLPSRRLKEKKLELNLPTVKHNGNEYYELEIKNGVGGDYLPIALIPKKGSKEIIDFATGDVRIINENNILVYQVKVPASPKKEMVKNISSKNKHFMKNNYIVKSGDNLYKIAKQNKISYKELLRKNPQIKNKAIIHPGQKINL